MRYKKIIMLTIILICLLAVSAVSASEDIVNQTVSSDIEYQVISCDGEDVSCQSVDNQNVLKDVISNSKDNKLSLDDNTWWGYDFVEWYEDGEEDSNLIQAKLEVVKVPTNLGENVVTLKLTNLKDSSPIGNVEIGVKTSYDHNIYNIGSTDSKGLVNYHHPLETGNYSLIFGLWDTDGISNPTKTMDCDLVFLDISILAPEGNSSGNHEETNDSSNSTDSGNPTGTRDNGTFTELQNLVNGAPIGSIIYLENDYQVEEEFYEGYGRYFDGIIISKSLTIDGKGHSITGSGKRGTVNIFTISDDVSVTLKNMILTHGSRAISSVSDLNIINCTFTNNVKLDGEGGAIYCGGKLTVANSIFTENYAVYAGRDNFLRGGAIICGKESNIFNSSFENNTADRGSAVSGFYSGDVTLTDCTFYKNYGWDNGRLLIDNYLIINANVINCRFMDYKSSDNIVRGNVQNCIFTGDSILSTNDVTKFYGSSDKLYINLVNSLGNGIRNVDVDVSINGNSLTVKTDSNGHASVDLDWGVGSYDVVSSYQGISTTSKVTVKSTITTNDVSGTYSNVKATATFLGTDGKTLASRKVTFKAGDKIYAATTDDNGVATADVDLGV